MTKIITEKIAGKNFAAEFVHVGMLGLDGEKMSKSKGNLVFVHKLLDEGWDPIVIRYALINRKYSDRNLILINYLNFFLLIWIIILFHSYFLIAQNFSFLIPR